MKTNRILSVAALVASVSTSSFATLIDIKTDLIPSVDYILPNESFDLVVSMQPLVPFETVMTDFSFEFFSDYDAFQINGFSMLQPFDAQAGSLPAIEGIGDVFDPTFFTGSSVELVSLQLTAVGPVGTYDVEVEGLLGSLQGAYFLDQNLDFFGGDIYASTPLTIGGPQKVSVPDSASTGLMFLGAMGAIAAFRIRSRR
ncbi:hypothetical protein MLD52_17360 [Puniceicoccaceae bacterium K14]|nr:hypothetical protein [Puniceicoccaceae bacterium K14]